MMAANEIIRTFADSKKVYYLDLVPSFPPEGNSWRGLKSDGVHVMPEGYEAGAAALNPLLQKLGASTTAR